MRVLLYPADVRLATDAGTARFARRRDTEQRYGRLQSDHTVELEIEAIGAEIAVARAIGRAWIDSDRPDYDGDVGDGVQVRHTRYSTGRLLLHPDDRDDHVFFLVTGVFPEFRVVGYLRGARARAVGRVLVLQPGRPVIAVRQSELTQMKAEQIYAKAAA